MYSHVCTLMFSTQKGWENLSGSPGQINKWQSINTSETFKVDVVVIY